MAMQPGQPGQPDQPETDQPPTEESVPARENVEEPPPPADPIPGPGPL